MEKELLHILSERTGCMYLSDLKFIRDTQKIKSELEKLSPQDFPVKQWNDAINYLTETKVDFSSEMEAKNFLLVAEIITKQPM